MPWELGCPPTRLHGRQGYYREAKMTPEDRFYGNGSQRPANEGGRFFREPGEQQKEGCWASVTTFVLVVILLVAIGGCVWLMTGAK